MIVRLQSCGGVEVKSVSSNCVEVELDTHPLDYLGSLNDQELREVLSGYDPEDVFPEEDLIEWAETNGYKHEDTSEVD